MIPFISLFPFNDRSLADTSFRQTGHEGDDSFRGFLRRLVFRVDKQLILAPVLADPLIVFDVGTDGFIRGEAPLLGPGPQALVDDRVRGPKRDIKRCGQFLRHGGFRDVIMRRHAGDEGQVSPVGDPEGSFQRIRAVLPFLGRCRRSPTS